MHMDVLTWVYTFCMTSYSRKLTKVATNSYAVIIPKAFITKYGWKEHQKLSIADRGHGHLELRDWKRRS
jgi:bifunctional DNA-binding transcriptional regulator/antitoxin component of YhaV-PrlF toxin-antitoxin module